MQKWLSDLRLDKKIKEPDKIRARIQAGNMIPGIYLLTLSDNPGNILEMFPAVLLAQEPFARICPPIIGMAKGKKNARDMAVEILTEIYRTTGDFRVSEYFGCPDEKEAPENAGNP